MQSSKITGSWLASAKENARGDDTSWLSLKNLKRDIVTTHNIERRKERKWTRDGRK